MRAIKKAGLLSRYKPISSPALLGFLRLLFGAESHPLNCLDYSISVKNSVKNLDYDNRQKASIILIELSSP